MYNFEVRQEMVLGAGVGLGLGVLLGLGLRLGFGFGGAFKTFIMNFEVQIMYVCMFCINV
jgi:hypothetical protein